MKHLLICALALILITSAYAQTHPSHSVYYKQDGSPKYQVVANAPNANDPATGQVPADYTELSNINLPGWNPTHVTNFRNGITSHEGQGQYTTYRFTLAEISTPFTITQSGTYSYAQQIGDRSITIQATPRNNKYDLSYASTLNGKPITIQRKDLSPLQFDITVMDALEGQDLGTLNALDFQNQYRLTLDGKEVTDIDIDGKLTFKDGSTMYFLPGEATIIQSKDGDVTLSDNGKVIAVLEEEDIQEIFDGKTLSQLDQPTMHSFLTVVTVAKHHGISISDLRQKQNGDFYSVDDKNFYYKNQGNGRVYYSDEDIVTADGDLNVLTHYTVSVIDNEGNVGSIEIYEDTIRVSTITISIRDNNGNVLAFSKDGITYTRPAEFANSNWFVSDNGNTRFSATTGTVQQKNAAGEWEDCETQACQELESTMRKALDAEYRNKGEASTSWQKVQNFFRGFEFVLTEFQGLQGFSQLFWGDDLNAWRESVDEIFATLYLGTDYWTSDICATSVETDGAAVAFFEPDGPNLEVAAHIQAERSEPFPTTGAQGQNLQYLYKITFAVQNPDDEPTLTFNVKLTGERSIDLFSNNIEVDEGDSFAKTGATAIVQFSTYRYDEACIQFDRTFLVAGDRVNELCTSIVESTAPSSSYSATGSSAPTQPGSQGELNQI